MHTGSSVDGNHCLQIYTMKYRYCVNKLGKILCMVYKSLGKFVRGVYNLDSFMMLVSWNVFLKYYPST